MESFLLKVIISVLKKEPDLANLIFVLPNQRAGVYIKKHLKSQIETTAFFPEIITFDNLTEQLSGIPKTPAVELLFDFYQVYKKETPSNKTDSFEIFSNWANIVLNDFNEIDGYLVEPKLIFRTLKEINQLHNWNPNTQLTKNYLAFFQDLERYYLTFYNKLIEKQKGYQGLILREAVESLQNFIENTNKHFIFAGFNHLKTSESHILQELLEADKADVFWDISENLIKDKYLAGEFIRTYRSNWPYYKKNKFNWISNSNFKIDKIEIIGVPKSVGMLKYAGELISNLKDSSHTALILADQNTLPIALNSLPRNIEKINITMGFPLSNFPFSGLVNNIIELHIRDNTYKETGFYYKAVIRVLRHPIIQTYISGITSLIDRLVIKNSTYLSCQDINNNYYETDKTDFEILIDLFKPIENGSFKHILTKINKLIKILKNKINGVEKEVLYRHYQLNQQLETLMVKYNHITNINALYQVYKQILYTENLNFIGEPLQGLQIMGFLETQALDFKHVILTSLNEGIIPKGKRANSFIPFDVRKHYKLPTYQEENAITSYHFYRLLESANKVSLLYNNQTDTFGGGEKSQFLTQLLWKYPKIKQIYINPKVPSESISLKSIKKTPQIIEKLKDIAIKGFSPSALSTYLYNPIEFYQQRILGICELDEIEETLADNTMGTVIHNTLENLYKPFINKILTDESLQKQLQQIHKQVKIEFKKAYKNGQYTQGKNKLTFEVIINYVTRFIKDEIKRIKRGQHIRIIALELPLSYEFKFRRFDFPIKFKGKVDRIDEVDGIIRIVDYKSGRVDKSHLHLDDFSKILADYKYSKSLQVLLYAYLYSKLKDFDSSKELRAGIISFKNLKSGFIPVNFALGRQTDYQITSTYFEQFLIIMEDLLVEIFDISIPFMEND